MYPFCERLRRYRTRFGEACTTQCVFYLHANANASELLVSHQRLETVLNMLLSVYRHTPCCAVDRQRMYDTCEEHMIAKSDLAVQNLSEEYSCVGTEKACASSQGDRTRSSASVLHRVAASDSSYNTLDASFCEKAMHNCGRHAGRSESLPGAPTQSTAEAPLLDAGAASASLPLPKYGASQQLTEGQRQILTKLNPLALPVGAYVSVFSSKSEYTRLTRCHRTGPIRSADVFERWMVLVRCTSRCILNPSTSRVTLDGQKTQSTKGDASASTTQSDPTTFACLYSCFAPAFAGTARAEHAGAMCPTHTALDLSGVYAHRRSASEFELGIVTNGEQPYAENAKLVAYFAQLLGVPTPFVRSTLPIGAALRCVSLKLWWSPQESRVIPGAYLAPIEVVLEELYHGDVTRSRTTLEHEVECSDGNSSTEACASFFCGYDAVCLMLTRPIYSQLRGTRTVSLPHTPVSCAVYAEETTPSRRTGKSFCGLHSRLSSALACAPFQKYVKGGAPLLSGSVKVTRRSCGLIRASLWFTDLRVTTTGEHMLAVEVRPATAYRPFVSTLCDYVTPFLVVPSTEAYR
ncbi:hypothetical protein ABL78_5637 [Leptomonas seymouri]|uniref:Uncharacterized protein n=1 Tax=Leptomonas seymouri TaxID=5684 RepID=A0A0N0P4W3_LEPSE|nr:hypothetical protein ABL78_5637 [Leptomonas seymouri]|eukprot:KPI85297.1 hypothetical protein ABL78_5637 [Leptomonas seymouri]